MNAKLLIAVGLAPVLRLTCSTLARLGRLWAYIRLFAALPAGVHPSTVVHGMPELHGTRRIHLGRELFLYRDLYLETQGAGEIRIGDGCVISRGVHVVAHAGIEVGDGTMIGEYTSIRDANHRFGAGVAPRDSGHRSQPVTIGRNVWIGRGVAILRGVKIGDGAVIGANAVVVHDVPANAVVGGIPARPIGDHAKGDKQ